MEIITKNAEETQKFGEELGASLAGGSVVALSGDLGSGKTTFVQGLARGLGITQQIVSPTFIIVRKYKVPSQKLAHLGGQAVRRSLYHVDLYRLEGDLEDELEGLGLTDEWDDPQNVIVIEWAEKAKEYLPKNTKWVHFGHVGESERRINIK